MKQKSSPSKPDYRSIALRILALAFVLGLSALLFSMRHQVRQLAVYGYPGIFLLALLANATVLFPAPGLAVVFTMGSIFNPIGVALSAALGGSIGELTGYLAGWSGQAVIERMDIYKKVSPYIQKYGVLAVFVLAVIPNPTFDVVGIAAGALKIPLWQFFLAVVVALVIKMTIFAYAGSFSINWFFR
jgi:membrane protein DedA with SNARE-associated domain